ncbi:SRPBCC domain-containing protein [Streptomyces lunaelactis]|uniref:SRPBCC domain-containing protein n=1 Tax=Streptomyces lunaelactis TaxID=1535768 RepID=UPI001585C1E7|nr:SRPBCC domain-containing protein [Streptomyces lunaelactis]NUL14187.1 SRPBCC family protein [Streptomyces lunaelactis]NUL27017.1 SRPBCC family protein [Streptomyces lunaelactis]
MEHEVFVPLPAETLRQALRDPARVARCIPGIQQDADESAGPLAGRLKVRIGGHTITYRGALRIVEHGDTFTVEGDGVEVRGTGSAKVTLTIRPEPAEGGTTLTFTGTSRAEGRLAELADSATESAAHRLLDRFADRLAVTAEDPAPEAPGAPEVLGASEEPSEPDQPEAPNRPVDEAPKPSVFDAPVPPPPLDPVAEQHFDVPEEPYDADEADDADGADAPRLPEPSDAPELDGLDELPVVPDEPPAEAAHARRTMIGRSAEEVDHAPPRGRYAPMPAPEAGGASATLRWIAPAAALALASAVVVGRALRRRK